jgi:hypothetical protein
MMPYSLVIIAKTSAQSVHSVLEVCTLDPGVMQPKPASIGGVRGLIMYRKGGERSGAFGFFYFFLVPTEW